MEISLITMAHRVSRIHQDYSEIHTEFFSVSFSLARFTPVRSSGGSSYCAQIDSLQALEDGLNPIRNTIEVGNGLTILTTVDREFSDCMAEYVEALQVAIARLKNICQHNCNESRYGEPYSSSQAREDRVNYDHAILDYQRHGQRLRMLFDKL